MLQEAVPRVPALRPERDGARLQQQGHGEDRAIARQAGRQV